MHQRHFDRFGMATSHFLGIILKAGDSKNECHLNFAGLDHYGLLVPGNLRKEGQF